MSDLPIATAPDWMINLAGQPIDRPEKQTTPTIPPDSDFAISLATAYLQSAAPALQGSGGDHLTFITAAHLKDLGLSPQTALDLMLTRWNDRCEPPWDPGDLERKVDNVYRYGANQPGSANPEAVFSEYLESDAPDNIQNLLDHLITLDDADPEDLPESIVERLVPPGEVTLGAGHGGTGKSYGALLISVLVVLGRNFGRLKTKSCKVLFFSAEDGKAVLKHRVRKICRALDITMSELNDRLYIIDASDLDAFLFIEKPTPLLDKLSALVQRLDVGLIVIDNASDTFGGDEIRRVQVRAFVRALRTKLAQLNRAVLLLAHVNKVTASQGSRAGSESYSGSTAWNNSCRSRISFSTDKYGNLELQHQKANHSLKADPIGFTWVDGVPLVNEPIGDFCDFDPEGQRLLDEQERIKDEADRSAILAVIREFFGRGERVTTAMQGSATIYHLLKACDGIPAGITSERFNRLVRDLESKGLIIRKEMKNKYRRPCEGFVPAPIPVGTIVKGLPSKDERGTV